MTCFLRQAVLLYILKPIAGDRIIQRFALFSVELIVCCKGIAAVIGIYKSLIMKISKSKKIQVRSIWYILFTLCCMPVASIFAQIPRNTPHPGQPSSINIQSPFEIIMYFVLPAIAIIAFIWLKRRKARIDKEKEESV